MMKYIESDKKTIVPNIKRIMAPVVVSGWSGHVVITPATEQVGQQTTVFDEALRRRDRFKANPKKSRASAVVLHTAVCAACDNDVTPGI